MTPGRRRAIVLLAGSLMDLEPAAGVMRWPGQVRGEAPSRWELCPACGPRDTPGELVDRFGRRSVCDTCAGKGRVRVDAYTGRQVSASDAEAPALTQERECGRCHGSGVLTGKRRGQRCPRCDGAGYVRVPVVQPRRLVLADPGEALVVLDDVERQVERRWHHADGSSYHALELCLAELRRRSVHRWRVFVQCHVRRVKVPDTDLCAHERAWLEEAFVDLDRWLPSPLKVPAAVLAADRAERRKLRGSGRHVDRQALDRRDDELRARYEAGERAADLAVEYGIGAGAVLRAVERAEARERVA